VVHLRPALDTFPNIAFNGIKVKVAQV
jgi:hypothetical protein